MSKPIGDIELQIMWNRLIAVVEEQAQTLLRTAFSAIVREAGDLSAGIFDAKGRMLAQAVTGTPGHVNSMAESVKHFIAHFGLHHAHATRRQHLQRHDGVPRRADQPTVAVGDSPWRLRRHDAELGYRKPVVVQPDSNAGRWPGAHQHATSRPTARTTDDARRHHGKQQPA